MIRISAEKTGEKRKINSGGKPKVFYGKIVTVNGVAKSDALQTT
jgi:hypothetical protein